jgi:hypothetical protein
MTLNHSFGDQTLKGEQITWPGDAESLKLQLNGLKDEWLETMQRLDPRELAATKKSWGPVQGKTLSAIVGWVNMELMKNAAELGYVRYLYTQR